MKVQVKLRRIQETSLVIDLEERDADEYQAAIGFWERARVIEEAVGMGAADGADWEETDFSVENMKEVEG